MILIEVIIEDNFKDAKVLFVCPGQEGGPEVLKDVDSTGFPKKT